MLRCKLQRDLLLGHSLLQHDLRLVRDVPRYGEFLNRRSDRQCQLLQAAGGRFAVYAGIDTAAFEGLCHGAHGWISGIPSTVPRPARRLYELLAVEGNLPAARELWALLAPLMRLQFQAYHSRGEGAHWFSTMKAALNLIGPPVGDPQPPIRPLPAQHRETLMTMLRNLGYQISGQ